MTATEMKYNFMLKFNSLFEFSAPAYDDRQISWLLSEGQFRVFIRKFDPIFKDTTIGFEGNEVQRRDLEQLIRQAYVDGLNVSGTIPMNVSYSASSSVITLDDPADMKFVAPGAPVTGDDIPADSVVTHIVSDTSFQINNVIPVAGTNMPITTGIGKSSSQVGVHPGGIFLDLPAGFLYAIEESAITDAIPGQEVNVLPVRHDTYRANIRNPYKKPYDRLVWRMDYSRNVADETYNDVNAPRRTELIPGDTNNLEEYRVRYLQSPPDIVVNELVPEEERNCILDDTLHRAIVDEAVVVAKAAVDPQEYQLSTQETTRARQA